MYSVINGKWSHLDGETLDPIDKNKLSKKINDMKPIAKITHSSKLTTIFHLINTRSERTDLINKIFNQSDSAITIINSKI